MAFSCEKRPRHYLGYKMENIVHQTKLLGLLIKVLLRIFKLIHQLFVD